MMHLLDRVTCYTAITAMLQQLLDANHTHVPPTHSPVKPGPPSSPPANQNQPPTPKQQVKFNNSKIVYVSSAYNVFTTKFGYMQFS